MTSPLPGIEGSTRHGIRFQTANAEWLESDSIVAELRRVIPRAARKEFGQYFTSDALVTQVWAPVLATLTPSSVVVDPACGSGNLLMPAAEFLREQYGPIVAASQVRGHDLSLEFAVGTRDRIAGLLGTQLPVDSFTALDYMGEWSPIVGDATHVAMNPPYIMVNRPHGSAWANRRVNAAAAFVTTAISQMTPGSHLIAILPDVLRSGSSYAAWRLHVAQRTTRLELTDLGPFDSHTDVDVFALHAVIGDPVTRGEPGRIAWPSPRTSRFGTISDNFEVRVGSVVPHRTPGAATKAPFITARDVSPWSTIETVGYEHPVATRLDRGPFVIVRRTSSPRDQERVRASLIADTREIGVENHLIVLRPIDGSLASCEALITNLRNPQTDEYMNDRIRCRHLTTESVKDIPWWFNPGRSE